MTLLSSTVKTARDGELVIKDGSGTPNELTVTFDAGDISISRKQNVTVIKDRGAISHFREGEDEPVAVSFSAFYTGLYGSSATLYEALFGENNASSWTSTTDGASDIFTVDLELTYTDVDGSSQETIKCEDFAIQEFKLDEAMEGNKISISGICKAKSLTIS